MGKSKKEPSKLQKKAAKAAAKSRNGGLGRWQLLTAVGVVALAAGLALSGLLPSPFGGSETTTPAAQTNSSSWDANTDAEKSNNNNENNDNNNNNNDNAAANKPAPKKREKFVPPPIESLVWSGTADKHEFQILNDHSTVVNLNWRNPDTGDESLITAAKPSERVKINSFLGHILMFREANTDELVGLRMVTPDVVSTSVLSPPQDSSNLGNVAPSNKGANPYRQDLLRLGLRPIELPGPDWEGWQTKDRLVRFHKTLALVQHQRLPNFTAEGFKKIKIPEVIREDVMNLRQRMREQLANGTIKPEVDLAVGSVLGFEGEENRPLFMPAFEEARTIMEKLRPYHEEWIGGIKLVPRSAYALRVYQKTNTLAYHVDVCDTHVVSCILHIDHDTDEDWPIYIHDHNNQPHAVTLETGEMAFYESAKLPHYRPDPMKGNYFASIFIHYQPVSKEVWPYTRNLMKQLLPKGWDRDVETNLGAPETYLDYEYDLTEADYQAYLEEERRKQPLRETAADVDKVEANPKQRRIQVYNNYGSAATLYWLGHDGQEVKQFAMKGSELHRLNTYTGHVFVCRDDATGELVSQQVIKSWTKTLHADPRKLTDFHRKYEKLEGRAYINTYPREPLRHFVFPDEEPGTSMQVQLKPGHMTKAGGLPPLDSTASVNLTWLSNTPKILVADDFLSADECDHIVDLVKTRKDMRRSMVEANGVEDPERTSTNTWVTHTETDVIERISRRAFDMLNIPFDPSLARHAGESIQVIHYGEEQHYNAHHDWFPPNRKDQKSPQVSQGYNRYVTLFLYLNDVARGGETYFPNAPDGGYVDDACNVDEGFKVQPKKGRVAIFFSMLPDGNLDEYSLHGACRVKEGEKWAANFWLWDPAYTVAGKSILENSIGFRIPVPGEERKPFVPMEQPRHVMTENTLVGRTVDLYQVLSTGEERLLGDVTETTHRFFTLTPGDEVVFRDHKTQALMSRWTIENWTKRITADRSTITDYHLEYEKRTGTPWLNTWPRRPLQHYVFPHKAVGTSKMVKLHPQQYTKDKGVADINSSYRSKLTWMANDPKILLVEDFLSSDECEHIKEYVLDQGRLRRSMVASNGKLDSERTSSNDWVGLTATPVVENIARRGYSLLRVPFHKDKWRRQGEPIQAVHYNFTQKYREHHDWFNKDMADSRTAKLGHNRYVTLFLYLNDVPVGGETYFPRVNGSYVHDCCTSPNGFRVPARKGTAAIFFSMLPDGNLDIDSLHGACPVGKPRNAEDGVVYEKWGANFWLWDVAYSGHDAEELLSEAGSFIEEVDDDWMVDVEGEESAAISSNDNNSNDNNNNEEPSAVDDDKANHDPSLALNDDGSYRAFSVVFENNADYAVDLYYLEDGEEKTLATLSAGENRYFDVYDTNVFVFKKAGASEELSRTVFYNHKKRVAALPWVDQARHRAYERAHHLPWMNVAARTTPVDTYVFPDRPAGTKQTLRVSPPHYHKDDPATLLGAGKAALEVEWLSNKPKVVFVENFLSADEADHLVSLTKTPGRMGRSEVLAASKIDANRTSTTGWVKLAEDKIVETVARRGFNLLRLPFTPDTWQERAESLQLLQYRQGQHYAEHYDWLNPKTTTNLRVKAGHNRVATLFLYLTDVEEGGETVFPRHNNKYIDNACESPDALKVKPKKGGAAIFYSMLPDGNLDMASLHAACPVKKGIKVASNFWIWDPTTHENY